MRRPCRPVVCLRSVFRRWRGTRDARSKGDFAPTYPFDQCGLIFKGSVADFLRIANVEKQTVYFRTYGRMDITFTGIDQFLGIGFTIEKFRRKSNKMAVFPPSATDHVRS